MSRGGLGSSPGALKRLHGWTRDPRKKGVGSVRARESASQRGQKRGGDRCHMSDRIGRKAVETGLLCEKRGMKEE